MRRYLQRYCGCGEGCCYYLAVREICLVFYLVAMFVCLLIILVYYIYVICCILFVDVVFISIKYF